MITVFDICAGEASSGNGLLSMYTKLLPDDGPSKHDVEISIIYGILLSRGFLNIQIGSER